MWVSVAIHSIITSTVLLHVILSLKIRLLSNIQQNIITLCLKFEPSEFGAVVDDFPATTTYLVNNTPNTTSTIDIQIMSQTPFAEASLAEWKK